MSLFDPTPRTGGFGTATGFRIDDTVYRKRTASPARLIDRVNLRRPLAMTILLCVLSSCTGGLTEDLPDVTEVEQRPDETGAPPESAGKTPALATLPGPGARPLDPAEQRQRLARGLMADRQNAQYTDEQMRLTGTIPPPGSGPSSTQQATLGSAPGSTPRSTFGSNEPPVPSSAPRTPVAQAPVPPPAGSVPSQAPPPAVVAPPVAPGASAPASTLSPSSDRLEPPSSALLASPDRLEPLTLPTQPAAQQPATPPPAAQSAPQQTVIQQTPPRAPQAVVTPPAAAPTQIAQAQAPTAPAAQPVPERAPPAQLGTPPEPQRAPPAQLGTDEETAPARTITSGDTQPGQDLNLFSTYAPDPRTGKAEPGARAYKPKESEPEADDAAETGEPSQEQGALQPPALSEPLRAPEVAGSTPPPPTIVTDQTEPPPPPQIAAVSTPGAAPPAEPATAAPVQPSAVTPTSPVVRPSPTPPPLPSRTAPPPLGDSGPLVISSRGATRGGRQVDPSVPPQTLQAPAAARQALVAGSTAGLRQIGSILFSHGSAQLTPQDRRLVAQIAQYIKQNGGTVKVVGHSSSRTREMDASRHSLVNFEMSLQRAQAVANELIRQGLSENQVVTEAKSNAEPLFYEWMPSGEAGNRRADIFVFPG